LIEKYVIKTGCIFYPSFSCNNFYEVSKILDFQLAEAKNLAPPIFHRLLEFLELLTEKLSSINLT